MKLGYWPPSKTSITESKVIRPDELPPMRNLAYE